MIVGCDLTRYKCPRPGCGGRLSRDDGRLTCVLCEREFKYEVILMLASAKVVIRPEDRAEMLERIDAALQSGNLTQGKNVKEFEDGFRDYVGTNHALAVSSGGAALEICLRHLLKDKPGAEVLVPTNTFWATASSVILAGGKPRLMDIDPLTGSPAYTDVVGAAGPKVAGVIMVHVGGIISPQLDAIRGFCEQNGLFLLEDCAHAHGSRLGATMAGRFGIAGCFSFFPTKTMTSGEGGMVVTDDDELAKAVAVMRDYGKPEPWVSYHTTLGANWRMNELEGAVGVVQLKRLDAMIAWRADIAEYYRRVLLQKNIAWLAPCGRSSWYKFIALLPENVDKAMLREEMKKRDVSLSGGVYDVPLHKQPVMSWHKGEFPHADYFSARHVCLPLWYQMTDGEATQVAMAFMESLEAATG